MLKRHFVFIQEEARGYNEEALQAYLFLFIISTDDNSCETIARCHFSNQQYGIEALHPQVLFHRSFIGGASVVVPQCYMLCLCYVGAVQSLNVFILSLPYVQFIYFSNGN